MCRSRLRAPLPRPHVRNPCLCGVRLYCGFEDAIEVFDIHRPGEGTRLRTTPSKKSRDGLKGKFSRTSLPRLGAQTYSIAMLIGRNRIGAGIRTRCVIGRLRSRLVQPLLTVFVQHCDLLRRERRGSHNVRRGGRSTGRGWSGVWGAGQRFSGEPTASARDKGPRLRRPPADV